MATFEELAAGYAKRSPRERILDQGTANSGYARATGLGEASSGFDTSFGDNTYNAQKRNLQGLYDSIYGNIPSVAQNNLTNLLTEQQRAGQSGLVSHGGAAADVNAAHRSYLMNNAQNSQLGARQSMLLGDQERQAKEQLLAQMSGQFRNQGGLLDQTQNNLAQEYFLRAINADRSKIGYDQGTILNNIASNQAAGDRQNAFQNQLIGSAAGFGGALLGSLGNRVEYDDPYGQGTSAAASYRYGGVKP